MRAPIPRVWAGICDMCSNPFLIGHFPHHCLCPNCFHTAQQAGLRDSRYARGITAWKVTPNGWSAA